MKLAENFVLEELVGSGSHPELVFVNRKEAERYIDNLRELAEMLQKIRNFYGKPIRVYSGFRGKELNRAVGGSKTSQHMYGEAADFVVVGVPVEVVFQDIIRGRIGIRYSQVIQEKDRWIHIGLATPRYGKEGIKLRYDGERYSAV